MPMSPNYVLFITLVISLIYCSWWPYTDPQNKFTYFFQVLGGGLAVSTTYNGVTCTLPNAGYVV